MPLPATTCAADVPGDVCCDSVFLYGERIRTIAFAAVSACLDDECRQRPFRTYQTSGPRSLDAKGESLIICYTGSGLRPSSTDARSGSVRAVSGTRHNYLLELREGPWPIIHEHSSTQSVKLPEWELIHALNQHAVGHAEKMWRALINAAGTTIPEQRMFSTSLHPHILNNGVGVSELTAMGPSGPSISYQVRLWVDTALGGGSAALGSA